MKRLFVVVSVLCLYRLSSGQECRDELLEDVNFPGSNIKYIFSPDENHCQQMCTEHPSCQFFTYVRHDFPEAERKFYCYLKETSNGEPAQVKALKGVTSGYSLKACHDHSAPCFTRKYSNRDFFGADYRSLFTPDYKSCQKECTRDPGCQFFTWVNRLYPDTTIRFKCHLKFSWTVPLHPVVRQRVGLISGFSHRAQLSTTSHTKKCVTKYFPDTDINEKDLTSLRAASPEHCQVLCSAHPSCNSFSFESYNCHLKTNAEHKMVKVAKAGVTSGLPSRHCQQPTHWLSATYNGIRFQGSGIRFELLNDAQSCRRACNADHQCQFFTYTTTTFSNKKFWHRCSLKRVISSPAPPKVIQRAHAVSGFNLRNCRCLLD
ncbi:hypothetical protein WMY93_004006 [Mugilogobius chulae]|uniref:Apple domain-containing protein n=1 Tax=Mugilogobius chulae TaxID=88201 RepID=A0AAW0Q2D1_9GOBI